ncbi:MAG TPA: hypothetical protein V6C86_06335 [Oculatellaceae cyanobacterium]
MHRAIIGVCLSFAFSASLASASEDKYGIDHDVKSELSGSASSGDELPESISAAAVRDAGDTQTLMTSDDMGDVSASALRRSGEFLTKRGRYDDAIRFLKASLQKNYDDSDTHKAYAIAMEKKLNTQTERDPELFAKCVKEWLIILREEVGFEKLTFHGLNVPGSGYFFADETFAIPAKAHLQSLTGYCPRAWETDAQFIKRVTKAGSVGVSGKVIKKRGAEDL